MSVWVHTSSGTSRDRAKRLGLGVQKTWDYIQVSPLPGGVMLDSRLTHVLSELPYEAGHGNSMPLLRPSWEQMLAVHRRFLAFCPGTGSPRMSVGDRRAVPSRKKGTTYSSEVWVIFWIIHIHCPIHTEICVSAVRVCGQSCFLDHHMYQTTHFNFILQIIFLFHRFF